MFNTQMREASLEGPSTKHFSRAQELIWSASPAYYRSGANLKGRGSQKQGATGENESEAFVSVVLGTVGPRSPGGRIVISVISVFLFSLCYVLFLRLPEKKRRHCGGTWWVWLQSVVRRMLLLLEGSPSEPLKNNTGASVSWRVRSRVRSVAFAPCAVFRCQPQRGSIAARHGTLLSSG